MTRDKDEYLTLNERTEIAAKAKADLFISIHANANPSRKMEGVEVYTVKTSRKKDLDEEQRRKNEMIFMRKMDASDSGSLEDIVSDMMYQLKLAGSAPLAKRIAQNISSDIQIPNRGLRHSRFFVVRNTLMPAVLVETGYLTNRQDDKKLNSSIQRQKIAESIARSIISYASSP
jgi:N-acetylmuramoyl-L-alanine amidase